MAMVVVVMVVKYSIGIYDGFLHGPPESNLCCTLVCCCRELLACW